MHANGRIGFFSADGTHVVDLGGDEGDRFLDVHKFSEFSSLSYGQALMFPARCAKMALTIVK